MVSSPILFSWRLTVLSHEQDLEKWALSVERALRIFGLANDSFQVSLCRRGGSGEHVSRSDFIYNYVMERGAYSAWSPSWNTGDQGCCVTCGSSVHYQEHWQSIMFDIIDTENRLPYKAIVGTMGSVIPEMVSIVFGLVENSNLFSFNLKLYNGTQDDETRGFPRLYTAIRGRRLKRHEFMIPTRLGLLNYYSHETAKSVFSRPEHSELVPLTGLEEYNEGNWRYRLFPHAFDSQVLRDREVLLAAYESLPAIGLRRPASDTNR